MVGYSNPQDSTPFEDPAALRYDMACFVEREVFEDFAHVYGVDCLILPRKAFEEIRVDDAARKIGWWNDPDLNQGAIQPRHLRGEPRSV
jgi:hypothetical protein